MKKLYQGFEDFDNFEHYKLLKIENKFYNLSKLMMKSSIEILIISKNKGDFCLGYGFFN
jgi:hypothetical protein